MQKRIKNNTKGSQKRGLQDNKQVNQKLKKSLNINQNYHPLEDISCKIGDNACAAKHTSVIKRTGLFHPMNESQKVQALLKLQQQYGNRFVQRVIAQNTIQTKMKIGQSRDIYEQEANSVAEKVMQIQEPQLQRQSEEELLQTMPLAEQITLLVQKQTLEEEEEELQAKEISSQTPDVTPNLGNRINALKGGGQPLSESVRAFFEPRFGYDFSKVRIHTNDKATMSAQSIKARAYTIGNDIVFASGQYKPYTKVGQQLLAHELTHTIQQNNKGRASSPAFLQREADNDSESESLSEEERETSFWRDLYCRFRFALCFSACTGDTWDPDRVARCERRCRRELERCLRD